MRMEKNRFICLIFILFFFTMPVFSQILSPVSGKWSNRQLLVIDVPAGSTAFYSINGESPEKSGFAYDGPVLIDLDGEVVVNVSIIDKNDLDSPVLNPLGASLLNSRINTQNQFNDTKISKIVVNYIDETSKELGFEVVENGRLATYTFLFETEDLEVSNIQFISNDGNIIYHTINGDNFELNKTYQITQEMEVI